MGDAVNWFIHDLSLNGQYETSQSFMNCLVDLLRLRSRNSTVYEGLRCSRSMSERPVTAAHSFREVVQSSNDANVRRLILGWIDTKGPFWDDDREAADDDYFQCGPHDVTDQGAGEAARHSLKGRAAATFSFNEGGFDHSPLEIQHGLDEQPINQLFISNLWDSEQLAKAALEALPSPTNWQQVVDQAKLRFAKLHFADDLIDYLRRETFTSYLAERIFELLRTLQEFVESRNPDGTYSVKTYELIATHFSGGKSWFSDESDDNKAKCRSQLIFRNPSSP